MNGIKHGIHVLHDFTVGEAQDVEALASEIGCASAVIDDSLIGCVLLAIDFDNEPSAETAEIGNVGADGDLAPEMGIA
jgi:hypothetical protein